MNVLIKQITTEDTAYPQMLTLRDEVLRIPIGMSVYDDDLSKDKEDILIIAESDAQLIGCAMLKRINAQTVKLRQMAVSKDWQGQSIGAKIIQKAEEIAITENFRMIELNARENAIPFYEKLGYITEGPVFTEVGIPHRLMKKQIHEAAV